MKRFGSEWWGGERPTLIHRATAPYAGTAAEAGLLFLGAHSLSGIKAGVCKCL